MNRSGAPSCAPKLTQAEIGYYPILALKPLRSAKSTTRDRGHDPGSDPVFECYTIGHFRPVPG
jgi:hypothetical protein